MSAKKQEMNKDVTTPEQQDLENDGANLEAQIAVMEKYRITCEESCLFDEAETARIKIADLKEELFARHNEEMILTHEQQR